MKLTKSLSVCLWFDREAEEAVDFYSGIFSDFSLGKISRFGTEGFEHHGMPEGTAMAIEFTMNGMSFTALNGGPIFKFNEAISLIISCDTQDEIDYFWDKLTQKGGQPGPCGWLKDPYGLSWQVTPSCLSDFLSDSNKERKSRVEKVLFQMQKLDLSIIKNAYHAD